MGGIPLPNLSLASSSDARAQGGDITSIFSGGAPSVPSMVFMAALAALVLVAVLKR